MRFDRDECIAGPDIACVFNPIDTLAMHWSTDLRQIGVKIAVPLPERHLAQRTGRRADRPFAFVHTRPRALGSGWAAVVRQLARTLGRVGLGEVPERIAYRLEDALLTILLFEQPSNASEAFFTEARRAPPSAIAVAVAVAVAVERIDADPTADWSLTRLAVATGVSARLMCAADDRGKSL